MMESLEERDFRFVFNGGRVVSRRVLIVVSIAVSSSGVALSAGSCICVRDLFDLSGIKGKTNL